VPRPKHPTSPSVTSAAPGVRPVGPRARVGGEPGGAGAELRPIGKARLRALREAIRNGTYPTAESVEQGLLRMFTRPARRPRS